MVAVNNQPNAYLDYLRELIEAGKLAPIIDSTYPLEQAADAILHLEGGHVRGKVVVTVREPDPPSAPR